MRDFLKDLALARRQFFRRPLFASTVVATLAIGIGLNTAVFSAIDAMLLRPLPGVRNPGELVQLYRSYPGDRFGSLAVPDIYDLRERTPDVLQGLAGWTFANISVTVGGEPRILMGSLVTANYFDVLGVPPVLGRTFTPDEDRGPMSHPVVVLSYGGWQRLFGGDPAIVGRQVVLNGRSMEIVGVTPEGFGGAMPMLQPSLYVPLMQLDQIRPGSAGALQFRGERFMNALGRVAPGIAVPRLVDGLKAAMAGLRAIHPDSYADTDINVVRQAEAGIHPTMRDAQVMMSAAVMAVVSLLLLIACVNVANLFLARARDRSREMAVRLAIGGSRGQLVRQLLTESLLFAAVSSVVSLGVAWSAMQGINQITLVGVTVTPDLRLSPRVLLFTLAVTVVTAVVTGLLPAWQSARPAVIATLKSEGGSGRRRSRAHASLVVVQMAMSVVLLVSAGLFLVNLRVAETLDTGFDADHRLVAFVDPSLQGHDRARTDAFYTHLEERLRADARVQGVAFARALPLGLSSSDRGITIPGYQPRPDERMSIMYNSVSPGYFATLGIRLSHGRAFTDGDRADAPPVIIVNQAFADRYWPGRAPLGQVVRIGRAKPRDFAVVGVVPTGKYRSLGERPTPFMYFANAQEWTSGAAVLIHTSAAPETLASVLREAVRSLDPDLPVASVATLRDTLGAALLPARLGGMVIGAMGALGLALACIGLFGVVAHTVSQRTREIGVRLALGAQPGGMARRILRDGMVLVGAGGVLGLAGAAGAARLLQGVLYGASGTGMVFVTVPILLLTVAGVAAWLPARRAAAVDPLVALRED